MSRLSGVRVIVAVVLCLSVGLAVQAVPLQHNGIHHGTINGSPFKATVNGAMEMTTGVVSGTVTIDSVPPQWHPGHAAWSLFCISCANGAREIGDAENFYDILAGSGTYTHTRTYTFPTYPAETLKVSASFSLASNTLTYTGNWSGNTNLVPTDLDSVAQYTQTLLQAGDGLINVSGNGTLWRAGGDTIPVRWQGQYNLGSGHNLPKAREDATIHIGFATTDNVHYTLSGNAYLQVIEPTLSEWGLIVFSLLILSLVTVAVARRKTVVAGAGTNMQVTVGGRLFVAAVYVKTLLVTASLAAVGLAISAGVYGSLAMRDIIGTFLSAGIVAYMAHVVIIRRKED